MSIRVDKTSVPGENFKDKMAHVVGGKSRGLLQRSGYGVGLEKNEDV